MGCATRDNFCFSREFCLNMGGTQVYKEKLELSIPGGAYSKLYPLFIGVPFFVAVDWYIDGGTRYIDGGMGTGKNPGPAVGNPWQTPYALL